ncbi:hypothetical protein ACFL6C_10840 [Myxococcota bacterium]
MMRTALLLVGLLLSPAANAATVDATKALKSVHPSIAKSLRGQLKRRLKLKEGARLGDETIVLTTNKGEVVYSAVEGPDEAPLVTYYDLDGNALVVLSFNESVAKDIDAARRAIENVVRDFFVSRGFKALGGYDFETFQNVELVVLRDLFFLKFTHGGKTFAFELGTLKTDSAGRKCRPGMVRSARSMGNWLVLALSKPVVKNNPERGQVCSLEPTAVRLRIGPKGPMVSFEGRTESL